MFEGVALESDVQSHYSTAGYWQGISFSGSRACQIVLIMASQFGSRPDLLAFAWLLVSEYSKWRIIRTNVIKAKKSKLTKELRPVSCKYWQSTAVSQTQQRCWYFWLWPAVCFCSLSFKCDSLPQCWTLHSGGTVLYRVWFQIVVSVIKINILFEV